MEVVCKHPNTLELIMKWPIKSRHPFSKTALSKFLLLISFIPYWDICKQHTTDSQAYELFLIPKTKEIKKPGPTGDQSTFLSCWQILTRFFFKSTVNDAIDQMEVPYLRKRQTLLTVYLTLYLFYFSVTRHKEDKAWKNTPPPTPDSNVIASTA